MKNLEFYFIAVMLLFMTWKITNDLIFAISGLLFVILTLLEILIPKKYSLECETMNDNLLSLKKYGKKIHLTKEIREAYKEMKEKEEIFNKLIDD